jgi:hypothetical protein
MGHDARGFGLGRPVPLSADTSLDHAITNPTDASDALIEVLSGLVRTSLTAEIIEAAMPRSS